MDLDLALPMVAFWQGFSIFFLAMLLIRLSQSLEIRGSAPALGVYIRVAFIASAAVGVIGYAGLYGNFPEQRPLATLLLILGAGAGIWLAHQVSKVVIRRD